MYAFNACTYSKDAEYAVLGACLISAEALVISLEILKPEDFYEPMHIKLFGIMS